ncbi:uncharacterized protein LOC135687121 [Rhopilema esculentum]|uniref:uncharacterized protein LOC135687121 n=1 Tax=Rhopilema esculentum TaxID=499914 RepID=UPI0031E21281
MDLDALLCEHEAVAIDNPCPERCIKLLQLWKSIFSMKEEVFNFTSVKRCFLFKSVLDSLNPRACTSLKGNDHKYCNAARNCQLLVLSFINIGLEQLENFSLNPKHANNCDFAKECSNDYKDSLSENQRACTAERCYLDTQNAILITLHLIKRSDCFVTYKSLAVFSKWFNLYPDSLTQHLDVIKTTFSYLLDRRKTEFYGIVSSLLKLMRKEMQVDIEQINFMTMKKITSQIRLITAILKVTSFPAKSESSCLTSFHNETEDDVENINKLRAIQQAKKLAKVSYEKRQILKMQVLEYSKTELIGEIEILLSEVYHVLKSNEPIWEDLFISMEINSFQSFIRLRILLHDLDNCSCPSFEMKILGLRIVKSFLEMKLDRFLSSDFHRVHGFGGTSFEKDSACRGYDILNCADGYNSWTFANTRMLVLITLKSFLVVLESEEQDGLSVSGSPVFAIDNSCRLFEQIALLLLNVKQIESKQLLLQQFPSLLVNLMMDEDDQLCEAVFLLLKICRRLTEGSNSSRNSLRPNDLKSSIANFLPHELFYCLLEALSFDHMVCIDWLICNETCFCEALVLYLETILSSFKYFVISLSYHEGCMTRRNESNEEFCFGFGTRIFNDEYLEKDLPVYQHGNATSSSNEIRSKEHSVHPSKLLEQNYPFCPIEDTIEGSNSKSENLGQRNQEVEALKEMKVGNLKESRWISFCTSNAKIADRDTEYTEELCKEIESKSDEKLISLVDYGSSDSEDESSSIANTTAIVSQQMVEDSVRIVNKNNLVCCSSLETGDADNKGRCEITMCKTDEWEERKAGKKLENIMDLFVRLRLKLERISGNMLSEKNFNDVITLLVDVEDLYDYEST